MMISRTFTYPNCVISNFEAVGKVFSKGNRYTNFCGLSQIGVTVGIDYIVVHEKSAYFESHMIKVFSYMSYA